MQTSAATTRHNTLAQRARFAVAHGTKASGLGKTKLVAPVATGSQLVYH